MLMARSPDQQIQQDRRQIYPFARQTIVDPSPVSVFTFPRKNAGLFKLLQAVGKNICRNPFPGFLEFLERAVSAHHQVTHDQQ